MIDSLQFHHIGIATRNIAKTAQAYACMGFTATTVVYDAIQKVNICFVSKANTPLIELVEPTESQSPINKILDDVGTSPYHICYQTTEMEADIEALQEQQYVLLQRPVAAVALDNRRICFLYNRDMGLIELLEEVT
ncbi:MAG: VOC family protein [Gammaproteobacteria bacterium]|nr:VOC family protein [Gammaproteobacteria bacterium]